MKSLAITTVLLGLAGCIPVLAQSSFGWRHVTNVTRVHLPTPSGGGGQFSPAANTPIQTQSLISGPVISEYITPEILALARNLENDPKRIYDYVHNYVKYVHYFGSKKGALLTLLEGSGNDFDQCALLVALLRAAAQNSGGTYTVTYEFGAMRMPYQQANGVDIKHWLQLGLDSTPANYEEWVNLVNRINSSRVYPLYYLSGSEELYLLVPASDDNGLIFHRVWVKLVDGQNTWLLDPAFKVSDPIAGIDVASAMQLNIPNLLSQSAVGATVTGDYVKNLHWLNLTNQLTSHTASLLADLKITHPNLSVDQVIGGATLRESTTVQFPGLPFPVLSAPFQIHDGTTRSIPIQEWDNIPTLYQATIRMQVDNLDFTYTLPELRGRKLSLKFDSNKAAQISLDDLLDKAGANSSATTAQLTTTIDHPYSAWDYVGNTLGIHDTYFQHPDGGLTYRRDAAGYAIVYGFDDPNQQLNRRQKKLDSLLRQGLSGTSPEVITETLNVMGLSWLQQTYLASDVFGRQKDLLVTWHHRVGRAAQETGSNLGYYVDLALVFNASVSRSVNYDDYLQDPAFKVFQVESFFHSAMEHGVIEQLQINNAASTVKVLYLANKNHQKLILAHPGNTSTLSTLLAAESVQPYTQAERNNLVARAGNAGTKLLLPSGKSTINAWKGYGFAEFVDDSEFLGFGMLISGGYNGAFGGQQLNLDPVFLNLVFLGMPNALNPLPVTASTPVGADPVNMADGSFMLNSVDLSVGQAEPRGFSFARHYDTNRRYTNVASMANGWIHNYIIKAEERSDPPAGLGKSSPQEMASFLVGANAAYEVYNGTPDAANPLCKRWALTALIAEWTVDLLKSNAVAITMGSDVVQFVRQANGVYTPPPGVTLTLTKPSAYKLDQRHGNTFNFNASTKRVTSIVDQYGKTMAFTYDANNRLSTVKDGWSPVRTLTLIYSGSPARLTSISDGTGRTVTFAYANTYSAQSDLVSVTDPEGKIWRYEYDNEHKIIITKDPTIPTPRVVVQNTYDMDGRVTQQLSEGNPAKVWRIYSADRTSVQVDPLGGRTVYQFDEKRRQISTSDANGNKSVLVYDGQDHQIQVITPKGEVIRYDYDADHNVMKITDSLLKESHLYYDSLFRLDHKTDFRNKTTTYTYNAKHQVLTVTRPYVNNNPAMPSVVNYTYNSTDGTLLSQSDEDGKTTSFLYDGYGQVIRSTYHNSDYELFTNHVRGDLLAHRDAGALFARTPTTSGASKSAQQWSSQLAI